MHQCNHCRKDVPREDGKQRKFCSHKCASLFTIKPTPAVHCSVCSNPIQRAPHESRKVFMVRKYCSMRCSGVSRRKPDYDTRPVSQPRGLPRVYASPDLRVGMTRSEVAAEMNRRYPDDEPYTVDRIEAIERQALSKLMVRARECKFIREWFELQAAS